MTSNGRVTDAWGGTLDVAHYGDGVFITLNEGKHDAQVIHLSHGEAVRLAGLITPSSTGCRRCAGPYSGPADLIHDPKFPGHHPYE